MKMFVYILQFVSIFAACNSGGADNKLKDPAATQPPSESIPDTLKIVNDSAMVPDTVGKNGAHTGSSDSTHRNK